MLSKDRQIRSESNASFLSYVNNKRRTSTILMKPMTHSKLHHKEKQKFLFNHEQRLVPIHSPPNQHQMQIQQMRQELTQALQNIRYIAAHCAHESLIESIRDEWKFIATVIDRLQFVIFLTVTVFGSLALLSQVDDLNLINLLIKNFRCLGTSYIQIRFE